MLLDAAHHENDSANLVHPVMGAELSEDQCATMRASLRTLYGAAPAVDPGAP